MDGWMYEGETGVKGGMGRVGGMSTVVMGRVRVEWGLMTRVGEKTTRVVVVDVDE